MDGLCVLEEVPSAGQQTADYATALGVCRVTIRFEFLPYGGLGQEASMGE